jgi:hypothetical protein
MTRSAVTTRVGFWGAELRVILITLAWGGGKDGEPTAAEPGDPDGAGRGLNGGRVF